MVHVKAMPRHAEVGPVWCVIIVYKNPIHYNIWRFKEYFIPDEEARWQKQYKEHVHTAPEKLSPTSATKEAVNSGCDTESTYPIKLERCAIGYQNSYQL